MCSIPIIIAFIAATAYGRIPWYSDCSIMPSRHKLNFGVPRVEDISDPSTNSVMTANNNEECDEGNVLWNYPQGSLRVSFRSRIFIDYIICFTDGLRRNHVQYQTLVGSRDIVHDNQNETCVDSADGLVEVQFDAPPMLMYMTLTEYRIIPRE